MIEQTRYVCRACQREWIDQLIGCPGCGSADVATVTFRGDFDSTTPPGAVGRAMLANDVREERQDQDAIVPPPFTLVR